MRAYNPQSRRRQKRVRYQSSASIQNIPIEEKYFAILNALRHSNKEQRTALLRSADKKLIRYICECASNILHGVVSLKNCQKNKLKKYKNILRHLITETPYKNSWKRKRRVILQKSESFLSLLLPPV